MKKLRPVWSCLALLWALLLFQMPFEIIAQQGPIPNDTSKSTIGNEKNIVSVKASFSITVSNQTLKMKEGMLRNAVLSFLTSGPNVLKATPIDQPMIKTKINNVISNATQLVEGIEATNAIYAVEITKALKSLISSSGPNQTAVIAVEASSTCISASSKLVTCENTVAIK